LAQGLGGLELRTNFLDGTDLCWTTHGGGDNAPGWINRRYDKQQKDVECKVKEQRPQAEQ